MDRISVKAVLDALLVGGSPPPSRKILRTPRCANIGQQRSAAERSQNLSADATVLVRDADFFGFNVLSENGLGSGADPEIMGGKNGREAGSLEGLQEDQVSEQVERMVGYGLEIRVATRGQGRVWRTAKGGLRDKQSVLAGFA